MATIPEPDVVDAEVRVAASPELVFDFFTDARKLVRWMGVTAEIDARPGGKWHADIAGDGTMTAGEILELERPRRLVMTWGWDTPGTPLPPGSSTVEVTLTPDGDETVVRVFHRDLPVSLRRFHATGWEHYLPRLAVAAAGSDPGLDPFRELAPSLRAAVREAVDRGA
jgi:uncharacterized protein YndB with AHSA1/START domain